MAISQRGDVPVQTRVIRGRYGLNWWHFECIVTTELTECAHDEVWDKRRRVQTDSGFEPKQLEEWVCHLIR